LMVASRSVYPWDIIVSKGGNKLFFDKRDESQFDLLSVNETATEPPIGEGPNSPIGLAAEATTINQFFFSTSLEQGAIQFFEAKSFCSLRGR